MVLKLRQHHWSPELTDAIVSEIGIFFSVWIECDGGPEDRLHYNLHALKLRQLKPYRLESRKFARAFREAFSSRSAGWPNVRTDYGPQTLFQGFVVCPQSHIEEAATELTDRFAPLADVVNRLLAA